MVSAAVFGAGDELDSYNVAFTIASFVISITAGTLQVTLAPIYLETKHQEGKEALQQLISTTFTFLLIELLVINFALVTIVPHLLPYIYAGFEPSKIANTTNLIYLLTPFSIISSATLFVASILNAEEEFKFTALVPGLTGIISVLSLIIIGKRLGAYALAVGVLIGALIEFTFLTCLLHKYRISLQLQVRSPNMKMWQIFNNTLPFMLASILSGIMPIIDQSFAAKLRPGDVAALSFGYRVISLYLTLFAVAVGTTVLPHFSKLATANDWEGLKKAYLGSICKFVLPVCVLSSLLIIIFSKPIVRVLFQRGAFTPETTEIVASIQSMYALQLPAYVIVYVSFRLLSALMANHNIIWIAVASLICCITFDYFFSRIWGGSGIALATSSVYWVTAILTLQIIRREISKRQLVDD